MKTITLAAFAAAAMALGLDAAAADAGEALAKSNGCLACHSVDKKLVGPSYKEVANKYRGDKNAAALLAKHVREGSKGVWGAVPMPPNAQVKDADIKVIVAWVLSLK